MKRIIAVVLCAPIIILCGCSGFKNNKSEFDDNNELVGVWITYAELQTMNDSQYGFAANYSEAIEKIRDLGANAVFVHVRAFCDAIYPSQLFPAATYVSSYAGDALSEMIEITHRAGIEFHAWINPYRVSTSTSQISDLPENSPAVKFLSDSDADNDTAVGVYENGIYLNPSSSDVQCLILDGIREITDRYNVDGIHFDDYFYPTADPSFDAESYEKYCSNSEFPLTIEEWRRKNVNMLISAVKRVLNLSKKDIRFGISPIADLSKCYNELYADVEGWIGGGYVDYIMPQLYFGFQYPVEQFCFENLLVKWMDIAENKGVKLYCGLASYKNETESEPDVLEWSASDDIVARQIDMLRENDWDGFVFFSYSGLFSGSQKGANQLESIKKRLTSYDVK